MAIASQTEMFHHVFSFMVQNPNEHTRGVFITTAKYSSGAQEFACSYKHGTIKLIDGKELVDLMMDFNLGSTNEQSFAIKRLDIDYFESDL